MNEMAFYRPELKIFLLLLDNSLLIYLVSAAYAGNVHTGSECGN